MAIILMAIAIVILLFRVRVSVCVCFGFCGMLQSSTSPPGGNQVDGLPPAPHSVVGAISLDMGPDLSGPEGLFFYHCSKFDNSFGF